MCATFADSQIYCEACYKNYETDKLVKATTAKLDSAKPADIVALSEEAPFSRPDRSQKTLQGIRLGFYSFCVGGLAWGLYDYNQPPIIPRDATIVQLEQTQAELIQCLSVFAEIGQQLSSGDGPALDLRCADTTLSNRVRETADELTVIHPNPKFYGAEAIFVSDKNPIPIVVPLDE